MYPLRVSDMFPQKTKWLKKPIGWHDNGMLPPCNGEMDGRPIFWFPIHKAIKCTTVLHWAVDPHDVHFYFCPKCMVKINVDEQRRRNPLGWSYSGSDNQIPLEG